MEKILAFLFFISSLSTAFCLAILGYTFTTGKLPFDIQPMNKAGEQYVIKTEVEKQPPKFRDDEKFVVKLYDELKKERENISSQTEELEVKKRVIEEIAINARKLQNTLERTEGKINNLMDQIDSQEVKNITMLSKLVSDLDVPAAGKMLMEMLRTNPKIVPRIMYFMKPKQAALILSGIVSGNDKQRLVEAVKVATEMQKLTEVQEK